MPPREDLQRRIRRYAGETGKNQGDVPTLAYKKYLSNISNEDLVELLNNCNADARLKAYAALREKTFNTLHNEVLDSFLTENGC